MSRKLILLSVLMVCVACGGRVPSPKTTQSATLSYFKKYGRKYPSSYFGLKNVSSVTINSIEESSYNHAVADTLINLVDGHIVRAVVSMERKFPSGWKVQSWETAGYQ